MQTLATGRRSRPTSGFSLIELMVVLVMIGLLGTAVLLTAPAPEARLTQQAERLAAHLVRAREEAVMGNRPVALRIDRAGYAFSAMRFGRWEPLESAPFRAHVFEDDISARFDADQDFARFEFDATGAGEGGQVVLAGQGGERLIAMDREGKLDVQARAR